MVFTPLSPPSVDSIVNGLRKCHSLHHLDFNGAKMGDGGVENVATFLKKNKTLTILKYDSLLEINVLFYVSLLIICSLNDNEITADGTEALAEALEVNRFLAVLTYPCFLFTGLLTNDICCLGCEITSLIRPPSDLSSTL